MPMLYPCAKADLCPYNGWTTTPLDVCPKCKADERRAEEQYRRLTEKDSRVKKSKKGWKK